MPELSDAEIVRLYREYSEACWCAGFMASSPLIVGEFRGWLAKKQAKPKREPNPYETEMLAEYHRQEGHNG